MWTSLEIVLHDDDWTANKTQAPWLGLTSDKSRFKHDWARKSCLDLGNKIRILEFSHTFSQGKLSTKTNARSPHIEGPN